MKFVFNDAGKATSKRPRQRYDCAVRAIAIAIGKPYDEVYEDFAKRGRLCGKKTMDKVWEPILENLGWTKLSFPAVEGQHRMNLERFCQRYPLGVYVVRIPKHLTVVHNGHIIDTNHQRPTACVYSAYTAD